MGPDSLIKDVVQFGLAGLIIYVILRPIITWFMARADEKDKQIRDLIERHFKHDEERHRIMISFMEMLPGKITESITKVYDPKIYVDVDTWRKESIEERKERLLREKEKHGSN